MPDDLTIDEAVDAAFEQAFAKPEGDAVAQAVEAEPAGADDGGRPRDEKGRFAAKPDEGAAEVEAEKEPAAVAEEAPKPEERPAIAAPQSWAEAERELWKSLPPEVQQVIMRRESDFTKHAQIAADRFNNDPIRQALAPVRQVLEMSGTDEATYIRSLVAAAQALEQNPYEAIAWLANQKGVDLTRFGAATGEEDQRQQIDPRLQGLQQRVDALTQYIDQQNKQREAATVQTLQQSISAFSSDPKNRFFDQVRGDMAAMARAGVSDDLPTLYEKAVWANPTTREQLVAERAAAERKKAEDAEKARQIKATAAALPRLRSEPVAKSGALSSFGSAAIDEAVDSAFGELYGT